MKHCLECKAGFEPKNGQAKFCSNRCRQKSYRKSVAEILKAAKQTDATIKIESAKVVQPKNKGDINDFWKQRMAKKLGIK